MSINGLCRRTYTLLFFFLVALAINSYAADTPLKLNKYPSLKLGFTSQNFSKWLPPSVDNLKVIIDFASKKGFSFIELRDPNAGLELGDAQELAKYAKKKNIEVIYAMGVGALDDNYFEVFSRGLANAIALGGPKIVRTGANGNEMNVDLKKQFWTAEEFTKLVQNLNLAANSAKAHGMTLYVENANEGLKGDGINSFGISDLFGPKGVNANVGFQLDMANFFCVSRVENSPVDVQAFFEAHVKRMGYSHLKTSIAHKPQQFLNGNELPFEVYFEALSKNKKVYVTIEHANADSLGDSYKNHQKSIDYLLKTF